MSLAHRSSQQSKGGDLEAGSQSFDWVNIRFVLPKSSRADLDARSPHNIQVDARLERRRNLAFDIQCRESKALLETFNVLYERQHDSAPHDTERKLLTTCGPDRKELKVFDGCALGPRYTWALYLQIVGAAAGTMFDVA